MNFAAQQQHFYMKSVIARRAFPLMLALLAPLLAGSGCSTSRSLQPANSRPFQFQTDTFAYANGLVWEYYYDEKGQWRHRKNELDPDYTHHCFVVARSARQFFQHAQFDSSLPVADEEVYCKLIKEVLSRDPSENSADTHRVVIPGYANLRSFSEAHEQTLKDTCGGAWQSYFRTVRALPGII